MVHHEFRRAHLRITSRNRKLDTLVLANKASENIAFLGIVSGLLNEPFGIANTFRCDQDPFGIHARQYVAKAFTLFADKRCRWDPHVVEKDFRGRMVHHRPDRLDGHAVSDHLAHIDQKNGEPFGLACHRFTWSRAREQQHQVGIFGAARPNLLAVDDIFVAIAHGNGSQRQSVRPAGWL